MHFFIQVRLEKEYQIMLAKKVAWRKIMWWLVVFLPKCAI